MIELSLAGPPAERGAAQARGVGAARRSEVRDWALARLDRIAPLLAAPASLTFARALWTHAGEAAPAAMAELHGIASGFGVPPFGLFCVWHGAVLGEAAAAEGCTTIAASGSGGAFLAKNRDVPTELPPIQAVFRQKSPEGRGGAILSLSSLGSSPAASSGVNAAGLALADTQVATSDHGVGLLRYLVMQRVLQRCRDVPEALALVAATRHAGGGTLVLADAAGRVAAVELGHLRIAVERRAAGTVSRTNHFTDPDLARTYPEESDSPQGADSRGRLGFVGACLAASPADAAALRNLLASHEPAATPVCRHAGPTVTVSRALYDPARRSLTVTDGPPCASKTARLALFPYDHMELQP